MILLAGLTLIVAILIGFVIAFFTDDRFQRICSVLRVPKCYQTCKLVHAFTGHDEVSEEYITTIAALGEIWEESFHKFHPSRMTFLQRMDIQRLAGYAGSSIHMDAINYRRLKHKRVLDV